MRRLSIRSPLVFSLGRTTVALFLFALAALGLGTGCSRAKRARVVAAPFVLYDLTRRLAGPDADVVFVAPDAAPATFNGVGLAVLVGLGFDETLEARVRSAAPKARILKGADRVPTLENARDVPPYVWMDPQRARLLVKAIAEELARTDASHASAFRRRAEELDGTLDAVDKEGAATVSDWKQASPGASVPPAFAYLGDRYGLPVAAPREPSPALDPLGADSYEVTVRVALAKMRATPTLR